MAKQAHRVAQKQDLTATSLGIRVAPASIRSNSIVNRSVPAQEEVEGIVDGVFQLPLKAASKKKEKKKGANYS
jgi:hypothetical protein